MKSKLDAPEALKELLEYLQIRLLQALNLKIAVFTKEYYTWYASGLHIDF